jgi:uncharacterized protein with PIN domain
VKFIADGMLGKLTRWLRMLGQDVEYSAQLQDDELIETAKNNHKILLTGDLELHKKGLSKGIESFYIEGNSGAEKLAKLAKIYGFSLEIDVERSRCPKCNTRILATSKEKIEGKTKKTRSTITTNSGNAQTAIVYIGRGHIGKEYSPPLKKQRRWKVQRFNLD